MTHYQLVASNKIKSWFVLIVFITFVIAVMAAFVYLTEIDAIYIPLVALIASLGTVISYWYSDSIVLTISGAREAKREEWFDFYTTAQNVAIGSGLPTPRLYVIDDTAMNAFATGRDPHHAVICATTGLLTRLDRSEIEAVVAHEMAHISNYDTRLMTVVSVLVGTILLLADFFIRGRGYMLMGGRSRKGNAGAILALVSLVFIILSPIIAQLIQLAISRSREYAADAQAIAITKNPQGLIDALSKLSNDTEPLEAANRGTAHLYIVNPLRTNNKTGNFFTNLFSTHPPIEKRIIALQSLLGTSTATLPSTPNPPPIPSAGQILG